MAFERKLICGFDEGGGPGVEKYGREVNVRPSLSAGIVVFSSEPNAAPANQLKLALCQADSEFRQAADFLNEDRDHAAALVLPGHAAWMPSYQWSECFLRAEQPGGCPNVLIPGGWEKGQNFLSVFKF